MPHRGGRKGRSDVAAQSDHLSAERLADIVDGLRTSSESATKRLFRLVPQQRAVDEPSRAPSALPQAVLREKSDGSVPNAPAPVATPAAIEPAAASAPDVEPALVEPAVVRPRVVESGVVESGVVQPGVVQPGVVQLDVVEPAPVDPAVVKAPVESMPAASKRGRHRAPASPRLVVRGFGLTSLRIALMGAVALLVIVAAVLLVLS